MSQSVYFFFHEDFTVALADFTIHDCFADTRPTWDSSYPAPNNVVSECFWSVGSEEVLVGISVNPLFNNPLFAPHNHNPGFYQVT